MTSDATAGAPRISFLTSAYRTEAFLPATIASVLGQTNGAWELVVVDNGNDDAIAAVVARFDDDERIRLVRQENKGYRGGVMAAAAAARGDYVSVLDSDDQLTPEFVEVMLHELDAHPGTDAIGCDAHLFTDDDSVYGRGYLHSIAVRVPAPQGDVLTVEDVLGGRVPYYTSVIRRSAWQAVGGYDPGIEEVDESVLIWLRLANDFQVRLIGNRLARYRVRDDSLSRDPDKVEAFEKALIHTFELFAEQSSDTRHVRIVQGPIRRLRYHQALRRARWAFMEGDTTRSLQLAREAFSYRPTPRAAAVVVLLRLVPRVLTRAYPLKQWVTEAARRTRRRPLV